ncbi:male sterility protein-domain-containing protein [Lentinula detonsa]|uniref:Male sterility protein-domain-containing protein n=1 Tax=Lentinula detonsa TaxID=2804962 RepID=A0AA38UQH7_9AGAR|nr:male sterility protein-domain-containing protein [Lentinula detonsa]
MSIFSRSFEFCGHPTSEPLPVEDIVQHAANIEAMIAKYSIGLDDGNHPTTFKRNSKRSVANETILLTGSTGNLGCCILASLLRMDHVRCVYALNRKSTNIMERHKAQFEDKALDVSLLSSPKLVLLEGEIHLPSLGLSETVINKLQQELTAIIHNAWHSNFSSPLPSFESHIRGIRTFIDLARSGERRADIRFLFTSSITMSQNWDEREGPYPENLVLDAKTAVGGGYGESKYVAERILAKSGLEAISLRIGQICGGEPNGAWKSSEWFPLSVRACWSLGAVFVPTGEHHWIPMDAASDSVLEIAFHKDWLPFAANLIHPRPVASANIACAVHEALLQELGQGLCLPFLLQVSVGEWIGMLERSVKDHHGDRRNASRLLSKIIYNLPPSVIPEIRNATKLSKRMRELAPIDESLVSKWVKFWIASGNLHRFEFCSDKPRARL